MAKKPKPSYSPQADAAAFEPARDRYLYAKYGIGDRDYDAMLVEQKYLCAICQSAADQVRPLVVDHNHATGKVRGLLCSECNTGIGLLGDSPALLRRAAAYLLAEGSYAGTTASPAAAQAPESESTGGGSQ